MSIFDYNNIEIPNCSFKISPSSIDKFFKYPSVWYEENILGKKSFTASTSTVLGTIVHAVAQSYAQKLNLGRTEIDAYIDKMAKAQPLGDDPIMKDIIKDAYPDMAMALINEYVRHNPSIEVEQSLFTPVLDDIYVGGTCDALGGTIKDGMIVDFKTHNSKTEPKSIPWGYKIQCLAYAYMYKKCRGIPINRIRLVYVSRPIDDRYISEKTGKPCGKIHPPKVTVLTETITEEDWAMIEDTLQLIAETVKVVTKKHPELIHLLFKSMKLKETK